MQKSTNLKKRVSDNSSSENTTKEIPTATSVKSSKKTISEVSRFSNIFQKLVCSNTNLADDESEVVVIPKSGPK
jgi:SMC interacting uncharacterized protein involved in chromosome segregation